jgi:hypothetical protein
MSAVTVVLAATVAIKTVAALTSAVAAANGNAVAVDAPV